MKLIAYHSESTKHPYAPKLYFFNSILILSSHLRLSLL